MVDNFRDVNVSNKPVAAPRQHKTSFLQWKEPSSSPHKTSQAPASQKHM